MGVGLHSIRGQIRSVIRTVDAFLARVESRVTATVQYIPVWIMAHRVAFSRLFGFLALGIALVSAVMFLPPTYYEYLDQPFLVLLVAVAALGASLWFAPRLIPLPDLRSSAPLSARFHRRSAIFGVLGLLLLAEISGQGLQLHLSVDHDVQFLLLCLSLALVAWGLGGGRLRLADVWTLGWWTDAAILIGLTLLALALRFWQLGTAVHYFVDEVNFTTAVSSFLSDFNAPLLAPFSSMTAFPWLFPYPRCTCWQKPCLTVRQPSLRRCCWRPSRRTCTSAAWESTTSPTRCLARWRWLFWRAA
jgi:hypothetical protein